MRRFLAILGLLTLSSVATTGAIAHPHVWVDSRAAFIFDDAGRVTAVKIVWRFDELYSAFAIQGSDADQDGKTDAKEVQALADNNVEFLAEWRYFTDIRVGLARAEIGKVTNYGGVDDDGTLVLWYELPLKHPVDVSRTGIQFRTYDPSYYVAFDADPEIAVELVGGAPDSCRALATPAGERPENVSDSAISTMTQDVGWAAAFAPLVSLSCG